MAKKKQDNCYIYTRVSTEMRVDGYSLDAQKNRLYKAVAFRDLHIAGEYCNKGKSGKSIDGRDEFKQMLADIAAKKDNVTYVLVFKLSRFGRRTSDVLTSLEYIQQYGVNLWCVEDNIDSKGSAGKLMISVLSSVTEIERENISAQTMAGRREKAREGLWNGGQAPYGYYLKYEDGSKTGTETSCSDTILKMPLLHTVTLCTTEPWIAENTAWPYHFRAVRRMRMHQ